MHVWHHKAGARQAAASCTDSWRPAQYCPWPNTNASCLHLHLCMLTQHQVSLDNSTQRVSVFTADGHQFNAKRLVMSLPLGVLKVGGWVRRRAGEVAGR